jgi:hypothetical protein
MASDGVDENLTHFLPKALNTQAKVLGDQALQTLNGLLAMPAPLSNFDGVSNIAGVAPPDTQGDIGYDPNTGKKYYIQWVNLHFAIWDVTNTPTQVLGPLAGNVLWSGFGTKCETTNDGDPITLFDPIAKRWVMTQFAVDAAPFYQCIAISQTADPTGSWYRYAFNVGSKMNDYPKFGVWSDAYYMTDNQFSGNSWAGAGVYAYERDQMLTGQTARFVYFDLYSVNNGFGGMLPADLDGLTPPPAGAPGIFVEVDDSTWLSDPTDTMRLWEFDVDWANTANSTFGLSGLPNQALAVSNFDLLPCVDAGSRSCIPQPGTTQKLDSIGDRSMYRLAYRNYGSHQSLVFNHSVLADGTDRAGVRWYELRKTSGSWAINQQGTYAPADGNYRWMGSIAQDHNGNMALGYSLSSSTVYPTLAYAGRLASDPAGQMAQGETVLFAGSASQTGIDRWGDYSMMGIDPQDDCTFWFTSEYSTGSWDWKTRIGSFKFPGCSLGPQGQLTGTIAETGTLQAIAGARVEAIASVTQTFATTANAAGQYTLNLPVDDYTVKASAYGYSTASTPGSVAVSENVTTTQNLLLTPVPTHTVSGVVTDAATGWPLYTYITIGGNPINPPAPYNNLWTNPVTGYYSVTLAENITFTLHADAWVDGYLTKDVEIGPLTGNLTQNIALNADTANCNAPGYKILGGFTQNFDAVTPSALPADWAVTDVSSTGGNWATNAGSVHPSGVSAHSAPNLVYFNSWTASSGNSTRLYRTTSVDMTSVSSANLTFWMYHDTGYTSNDRVQVQASTDGGSNWVNVGAEIPRYTGSVGWTQHTVSLSTYNTQTNLLIGFLGISAYGNDIHIDDITLGGSPACTAPSGGLVVGNVYEDNAGLPLIGAVVTNANGDKVTTKATVDTNVDDGFYTIFSPAGSQTVSASMTGGYATQALSVAVTLNGTVEQDFNLGAGYLTHAPTVANTTLAMDESITISVVLSNTGSAAATYALTEINTPYTAPIYGPFADHLRHLGPKNFNKYTLNGVVYYLDPLEGVPALAAGSVITSWTTTGLAYPWGIGFDTLNNDLWVGNIKAGGGDDLDYNFLRNGTATGDTINTASWVGTFAADMAFNPLTGMLWQVNVGGDNCVYELDPASQQPTGQKLCPPFGTSERGLAFDPTTNTFYAGSWNDSIINHFDASGVLLDSANVGFGVAGMAYNPATGHIFATCSGTCSYDVYVVDAKNGYAVIGGFNITGLSGGTAGLEMSCDGHLWAVNQSTRQVIEADSGETGVCDWMGIPWLREAPTSGTLAASALKAHDFIFDATGLQPGSYKAQVKVTNNTPYGADTVPVELTVTAPPSYGAVAGSVIGLGYCDNDPAALENAEVVIVGNHKTYTVTTSASGDYSLWLDAGEAPLNVYVTAAEHTDGNALNVPLTAGQITTQDFSLRWLEPCVSVDPTEFSVTVVQGYSTTLPLDVVNDGAISSTFGITEAPAKVTVLQPSSSAAVDARTAPAQVGYTTPKRVANPAAVLLSEGFEDNLMPPTGWEQIINNTVETWGIDDFNPNTGSYNATVMYDYAQDEWLLSPELNLTKGTLSFWSNGSLYWCRDTNDNCDLNVWIVVGDVGGGDDILVGLGDDDWTANWTWAQSTFDLTPLLPGGPVRIGFQYLGDDGAQISIDDIVLDGDEMKDIPWLSESPANGIVNADGSKTVDVTFDSLAYPIGTYKAALKVKSHDPLAPTASVTVTMTVLPPSYGIKLNPPTLYGNGVPSDTITYTLQITNTGNVANTFTVTQSGGKWNVTIPVTTTTLQPGETAKLAVAVTIPAKAKDADFDYTTITVTGGNNVSASTTIITQVMTYKIFLPLIIR